MNFAEAAKNSMTETHTENGAFAYNTTESAMLDFFSRIGSARTLFEGEIKAMLAKAWDENPLLALRCIFYAGAIRGGIGLGERRAFRVCLNWLAKNHPEVVAANLSNIAYYTRWDNVVGLLGTPCENVAIIYLLLQLQSDLAGMKNNESISLLAKWLPSCNTSSYETREKAKRLYRCWGWSERKYRRTLSSMRSYLKVTERKMSRNQWSEIDYSIVPSYTMLRNVNAFLRHDSERFRAFINNSTTEVHASTLFPYDLVHQTLKYNGLFCNWSVNENKAIEKQWDALPNYLSKPANVLVMADVSGSMSGKPLETSLGLAIYFAQHNTGAYKNLFMSFSAEPRFITVPDKGLAAALKGATEGMGLNTNLMGAMDCVLDTAIKNKVSDEDLPEALIVISDNEIDEYYRPDCHFDFWDTVGAKFHAAGYKKVPKLVLWNVDSRKPTFLTKREDVILVSGRSTAIFQRVLGALEGMTNYDFMVESLMRREFDKISLPENLKTN